MKFSLIFPSRGSNDMLLKTLGSIVRQTARLRDVEVIVGIDDDDNELLGFHYSDLSFKKYVYPRHINNFAFYYNDLASKVTGDVIWVWSTENYMATRYWDKIATKLIKRKRWSIWYGCPKDFVVSNGMTMASGHPVTGQRFSCFPMIPRKVYETLGFVHKPDLRVWGSDLYMYMLFSNVERIIPMDEIEVMSLDTSKRKDRMDIYREDLIEMERKGLAKINRETGSVAMNIAKDVHKLKNVIAIPRMYRLEMLK